MKTLFILLLSALTLTLTAQDDLTGVWYNTEKSGKIRIYEEGGEYFGEIVWLEEPLNENGDPKVNENAPDAQDRDDPILGLTVLKGFTEKKEGVYTNGTIYDPENGKTYKCKMTLDGDELDVRGYVGIPAFGRTENWTRTTL